MKNTGQKLWEKAKTIIPTGNQLLSKRSELFLPGGWPAYYKKASGCSVWDLDGNHYYDFAQMGVGSCVLGYADPDVNQAVKEAIDLGSMCTLNSPEEVELAELLIGLHPWSEMARFTRTGGEACAVAIRIARAATGKSKILFCGYHGWHDWYIASNLQDQANLDSQLLPGLHPNGVPKELLGTAVPFHFNNFEEFDDCIKKHGEDIACIIMEPRRSTDPAPGFLEHIRKQADRVGAVLIFDEVTSGFRVNNGGIHLTYNVDPDIAVFGKALGNGFPIAAVIGKRPCMTAAEGSFISSTSWTERVGFVAAVTALNKFIKKDVSKKLIHSGQEVNKIWKEAANAHGLSITIDGIEPLTHMTFNNADAQVLQTFFTQEMLKQGFLQGAAVYTTYAYTEEVFIKYAKSIDQVFSTIADAIKSEKPLKSYLLGGVRGTGFARLT
jgi:glutamate-1-semialdehyde 2,1-aminomutase